MHIQAISAGEVKLLKLHKDYRIITIYDIGNGSDAIVLENLVTRQVRYVRAYQEEATSNNQGF